MSIVIKLFPVSLSNDVGEKMWMFREVFNSISVGDLNN